MKNRRNMIVAFLLCACLIVGVGYAALTGQLAITGNARFNGSSLLDSEIRESVKFTDKTPIKNCDLAEIKNDKLASMDIVFNDANGVEATFDGSAKFEITYDTDDVTFPDLKFSAPIASIISSTLPNNYWGITSEFVAGGTGTINDDGTVTLAPGQTVWVHVTVTFDNNGAGDEVYTTVDNATISVDMNYETIIPAT